MKDIKLHPKRCDTCGHHKEDETFYGGCRKRYILQDGKPTSKLFTTYPIGCESHIFIKELGCGSWKRNQAEGD